MSLSPDASSIDQLFRNITFHWGLFAPYSDLTDDHAGMTSTEIMMPGSGKLMRCERSGFLFPSSRMTVDGVGRSVGRPFYTTGDPKDATN